MEQSDLETVARDGLALEFVRNKTHDVCMEAVKQNGWALYSVPYDVKTLEMCIEAVKQNGGGVSLCTRTLQNS